MGGDSKEARVLDWLIVAVLYVLMLVLFRWLGGFASAGRAFSEWGRSSSTVRPDPSSPRSL